MNTHSNRSRIQITTRFTLRAVGILAVLLAGLLVVGSRQVQADALACSLGSICAAFAGEPPAPLDPQLVVMQTTHAYTGPGYDYLNYGDLLQGYTSHVTGISADGKWLVIPLSAAIAPDGQAWVNSADVVQKNIQVIPDWLIHCDPNSMTYCGYVLAHTSLSSQVMPGWLANCDPNSMTYCAYVLAHSPQTIPVKKASPQAVKFGAAR